MKLGKSLITGLVVLASVSAAQASERPNLPPSATSSYTQTKNTVDLCFAMGAGIGYMSELKLEGASRSTLKAFRTDIVNQLRESYGHVKSLDQILPQFEKLLYQTQIGKVPVTYPLRNGMDYAHSCVNTAMSDLFR